MITVTEILGTDSISGSRIIINDNFAVLRDEINAIETFLDPDAGTIDGLNSLQSLELHIGPVGNYLLDISSSIFNVNTSVVFTQPSSLVSFNGLVSHNSFSLLDESAFVGLATIDPLVGSGTYSIKHASTSDFIIEVEEANPGQDITFSVEQKGSGGVIIQAATGAIFVIDSTNNKIYLDDIGSTVTLRFIIDSSNNGSFYIIGGHGYTAST